LETKTTEGDPPTSKARGQDYASMASHFEKLVKTVSEEALYQTNDLELTLEGLQQKQSELQHLNTTVMEAVVQLGIARTKLRNVLYTGDGNLLYTAMAAKFYLRSLLGYRSEQFAKVSKIEFHKPNM
jgi:hypothetical protein